MPTFFSHLTVGCGNVVPVSRGTEFGSIRAGMPPCYNLQCSCVRGFLCEHNTVDCCARFEVDMHFADSNFL